MGWPYEFANLTSEEKHARREVLDKYGLFAHYSALAPVLVFGLIHLARLAYRYATGTLRGADGQGTYAEIPNSPLVKAQQSTAVARLRAGWSRLRWWMGDEIYFAGTSWGRKDEWTIALGWTAWLLALCTLETGRGMVSAATRKQRTPIDSLQTTFTSRNALASLPSPSSRSNISCRSRA